MNKHLLLLALSLATTARAAAADGFIELSAARISQIESMLPPAPAGFGQPITDRAFWHDPATLARTRDAALRAEPFLTKELPAWSDELYLEYSKTGRRPPGEAMIRARFAPLESLVLAECLEDKGRFLAAIRTVLEGQLSAPCWTLPAHDGDLSNFHRTKYIVDLRSAATAADLAEALYLLNDRLPQALRGRVLEALEQRAFAPVRRSLQTHQDHYWLGSQSKSIQNNWNAVCLAGVVGAARTVLADRRDRAVFIAAGEHYSRYFINGFSDDGYCDEGPGYWVYGFGDFAALRELTADATAGRVDLFAQPKTRLMARYGSGICFPQKDVPPFADCRYGTTMSPELSGYCGRVFGTIPRPAGAAPSPGLRGLAMTFITETPAPLEPVAQPSDCALRSYFAQAGVLVCRPGAGPAGRMSAAIKAGGNNSHSHNDVGSFVISLDGQQPVGDPGGPHAYNNKVFGPQRYDYQLLNSFGHPVPVVNGQLQVDATTIKPKVLLTDFEANQDSISIDLATAYKVPALQALTRTMTYSRMGPTKIVIADHAVFSRPTAFALALTTRWKVVLTNPQTLEFSKDGKKLLAQITTPDGFDLSQTTISELDAPPFTRLGLTLRQPITDATVRVEFQTP